VNGLTIQEARVLQSALTAYMHDPDNAPGGPTEVEYDITVGLLKDVDDFLADVTSIARNTLHLWSDGAARPTNPGPSGIGVVGKVSGKTAFEVSEYIGRTTNNVAEYMACVTALRRAVDLGAQHVLLHTDSQLVVNQYFGKWRCNDPSLVPLLGRLRGLAQRFESFDLKWIPRTQNREADGLSVAGAYRPRPCGVCTHDWHYMTFCLEPSETPGEACGCPYGFKGGIVG